MIKTKIKKALAILALGALATTNFSGTFAAQIGTGSVVGDATFDSAIIWDDTFPGTATGTVSGIVVTADIAPTLNMTISTGAIALGTLSSAAYSTWSLDIEIGTNALNGVSITARSGSGGLANTSDNTVVINDDLGAITDGTADSYLFTSALNAASDSTTVGYTQSATLSSEVNDNTTEHTVYTTNKPEQDNGVNDVTFSVSAQPNAQTAAWNYQDTITFTVVGNF